MHMMYSFSDVAFSCSYSSTLQAIDFWLCAFDLLFLPLGDHQQEKVTKLWTSTVSPLTQSGLPQKIVNFWCACGILLEIYGLVLDLGENRFLLFFRSKQINENQRRHFPCAPI